MTKRSASLGLLAITLLISAFVNIQPAGAQTLYGSIVGTVVDASGAVVPKANITVTDKNTGTVRAVEADSEGRYSVLSLLPGIYEVKIVATGFKPFVVRDQSVTVNTITRADARLEVGALTEQVTVEASAALLQTDKSDVRHEITGQQVQNLPLPSYRNYQSLLALVPGATPPGFQNSVVDTPGRALRSFVNGTATNMNNTLVDGAVNINIWLPHHVAYVQPVESIETVNISTGSMDAEQGMAGGAAVTVATKSGTNTLHGTAWEFNNNQHFNSDPVYFRSSTYKKPLEIMNIFGGNLGGPIKKDKLFYFFNYERTTQRSGSFGNYSVAPEDFRRGDFSAWSQYSLIYDPATAAQADNAKRTPFPNNVIPTSRINQIFPNIYKGIPLPNQKSPTDPLNLSGNYGVGGVLKLNRNQYDTKINYNLSKTVVVWGKYSRMDAPVSGKYVFGDLGGPALGTDGFGDTTTQLVSGGFNKTFSPTFLMDGVFGYTRMDQVVGIPGMDKNYGLDVWKIPGTNGGRQFANDPRYGGLPNIQNFGFDNIGIAATWAPVWRAERSYTYQTNFSKLNGAHEFRWGFELRRMELNHWQPETANPRGEINFASGITNNPSQTNTTAANSYAAALLGLASSYTKSIQYFEMKTREWQYSLYFRDRWQVNRNLTLNLGLRYEIFPLLNRGDRGLERWDPATNIATFGGLGGVPRENGMSVSKKLFAPRVGLAYRLRDGLVLRMGYGLNYDPLAFGRPLRGLYPATLTGSWVPGVSNFGWFNSLTDGIPDIATPDTSKGSVFLPLNVDMGPRSPWGGEIHRGYIQSWNITLERKMPWQMVGSAGYVSTRTVHQLMDRNINSVGPGEAISTANLPLAKLYGRTIAMAMWDGVGKASYHSLQTALTKNFSQGLMLRATYTFGKALNMADENGWVGPRRYNWAPKYYENYSPAGYDRTHAFTAGWNYDIPVGKGKKVNLDNQIANFVVGGWKFAGTFVAYTGTPFTVTGSGSSVQATDGQVADQIAPVVKVGGLGPNAFYYDPMSFRDPLWAYNNVNKVYRFGNMGLNALRGPGYWQLNPGIFKEFVIKEKVRTEFRAESTNFTNTPIWGNPNAGSASLILNADGTLNKTVADPYRNFMRVTSATAGRQFRFGLRVSF